MMTTTLREPPISSCDRFRKQINKTNKGKSIVFQILFGVFTLFTKKKAEAKYKDLKGLLLMMRLCRNCMCGVMRFCRP
jgi:hypothetical protein